MTCCVALQNEPQYHLVFQTMHDSEGGGRFKRVKRLFSHERSLHRRDAKKEFTHAC
jgi:hypothetical protein